MNTNRTILSIKVIFILFLIALPFIVRDPYWIHIINIIGIYSILSLGLNILVGFSGQLSLGHAAFFGISAYTSALLAIHLNFSFWICILVAILVSAFFGLILSYPCSKLRGIYLAITTIGFGQIMHTIFVEWRGLTRGPMGLTKIPSPQIGNIVFNSSTSYYYIILLCFLLALLVALRINNSHIGRSMKSIRDDEIAAKTCGVDIAHYKMMAFVISAAFVGMAGSLYAHYLNFISPESFTFDLSTQMLVMILVGGIGSIPGSIMGAIIVTFIPEILRDFKMYQMVIYGATLILILIFLPEGISQIFRNISSKLGLRFLKNTNALAGKDNS